MTGAELSDADFAEYQALIYRLAGIHYPIEKRSLLQNRLKRRLRELKLDSYRAYLTAVQRDRSGAERQEFLNAVTTNETYFFRCRRHWEFFEEFLRERRAATKAPRVIRIWSAAASTGAEAYSAAIACHETLGQDLGSMRIEILGTDINDKVLAEARAGRYRPYAVGQTDPAIVARWFTVDGDEYVVDRRLTQLTRFATHNLLERVSGGPFDLVFLRNVMIYFDGPSKERVLKNVFDVLQPGGHLIVGESESLLSLTHGFTYVKPSVFRKPTAAPTARPVRTP